MLVPVLLNNFVSKGPGEGTGKSWEAKEGKVFPSGTFAYNLLDVYSQREIYLTSSYSGKINPKVHYSWFSRIKKHLAILSWLRRGKSSRRNRLIKVLKGKVSRETVVLRRWESIEGNLVLTTELKT